MAVQQQNLFVWGGVALAAGLGLLLVSRANDKTPPGNGDGGPGPGGGELVGVFNSSFERVQQRPTRPQ